MSGEGWFAVLIVGIFVCFASCTAVGLVSENHREVELAKIAASKAP